MGKFTYIGNQSFKKCAFCGTTLSVKYVVQLDTNKHKCPAESIVSPAKVYACNSCVAKKIDEGKL